MTPKEYAAKKRRESRRKYYLRNRDRLLDYQKKYDAAHRDERREYNRKYMAEYREGILRREQKAEEK